MFLKLCLDNRIFWDFFCIYISLLIQVYIGAARDGVSMISNVDDSSDMTSVSTPDILHCSSFQFFYVAWTISEIVFGAGTSFTSPLIKHQIDYSLDLKFNFVSVATGDGVHGQFAFYRDTRKLTPC